MGRGAESEHVCRVSQVAGALLPGHNRTTLGVALMLVVLRALVLWVVGRCRLCGPCPVST